MLLYNCSPENCGRPVANLNILSKKTSFLETECLSIITQHDNAPEASEAAAVTSRPGYCVPFSRIAGHGYNAEIISQQIFPETNDEFQNKYRCQR